MLKNKIDKNKFMIADAVLLILLIAVSADEKELKISK